MMYVLSHSALYSIPVTTSVLPTHGGNSTLVIHLQQPHLEMN